MKSPLPKINENFTLLLIERLSTRAAPPADDEVVGRAIFFSPPASANRLVLFPASIHLLSHGNFEIAAFLSTDSRRKKSVESWSGTEEEYIGMDPLSGFSSFFFYFLQLVLPLLFIGIQLELAVPGRQVPCHSSHSSCCDSTRLFFLLSFSLSSSSRLLS